MVTGYLQGFQLMNGYWTGLQAVPLGLRLSQRLPGEIRSNARRLSDGRLGNQ